MRPTLRIICEIVIVLMFLEVGMHVVWCQLERIVELILKRAFTFNKSNIYADMGGDAFTGFIISALAFVFFVNIAIMTRWSAYLKLQFVNVFRSRHVQNIAGFSGDTGVKCFVKEEVEEDVAVSPELLECLYEKSPHSIEQELPKPKRKRQRRKIIRLSCSFEDQ